MVELCALSDRSTPNSFFSIKNIIEKLPPIEELWTALPAIAAVEQMTRREKALGAGTLSCSAFQLLHEIVAELGIQTKIIRHPPSIAARTKQELIAGNLDGTPVLVHKTLTVRLGGLHFLFTGAGDFTIHRHLLQRVAKELSLASRIVRTCRINPTNYPSESELGLLAGIVSPFISPMAPRHRLQGVVLRAAADNDTAEHVLVAISLSPFESLVVQMVDFERLLPQYATRAYPDVRLIKVSAC
ncbi:hypothetical protein [Mycobacterium camsae]|uniref:hypothetical protein n=1 Tax=Mycobacterium gordonae TaxID=1778 RepID=UPI00197EBD5D|nr:hypothetical protein [Mycobacterium gordonae]